MRVKTTLLLPMILTLVLTVCLFGGTAAFANESETESEDTDLTFDFDGFNALFADIESEEDGDEGEEDPAAAQPNPPEGAVKEEDGAVWIEDENGDIVLSSADGDLDEVCECHNGYYLVSRDASGYYRTATEYGVFCIDGTWPVPMQSFEHPLRYFGGDVYGTCISDSDAFDQSMDLHFYSISRGLEFTIRDVRVEFPHYYGGRRLPEETFEPEYNVMFCDDMTYVITRDGVVGSFGFDAEYPVGECFSNVGPYADGGFVYFYDGLYFFDCRTMRSTLLWEDTDSVADLYPSFGGRGASFYAFNEGLLVLPVIGADGKTYDITIDKKGSIYDAPPVPSDIVIASPRPDIDAPPVDTETAAPRDNTPAPVDDPKTGDDSHLQLWSALLILCAVTAVGLLPLRKTKRRR